MNLTQDSLGSGTVARKVVVGGLADRVIA